MFDLAILQLWYDHAGDSGQYRGTGYVSFLGRMITTRTKVTLFCRGDDWHRLREDDFSAVDFGAGDSSDAHPRSTELVELIKLTMRSNPDKRLTVEQVYAHPVVQRAREAMTRKLAELTANNVPVFGASPLGGEPDGFVEEILQIRKASGNIMDLSP